MQDFNNFINFRKQLYRRFMENKATLADLIHGSFNYIKQHKLKPVARPTNREDVLLNYFYWQIYIERKVMVEISLIDQGLGSKDKLAEVSFMYLKRRDQMIRRLFFDFKEPIKEAYIIHDDVVEIILNDGTILYSTHDSLSKVKIHITNIKKTVQPKYIPAIRLK